MHRPFTSIEPATGEPVWAGESGDADIEVAIARAAWPDWTSRAIAVRMEYMRRFANAIRARMDDFVELIARETGSPLWEARAEIEAVIAHIEPAIAAYSERTPRKRAEGALGTRHAVHAGPLVKARALHPRNIVQQDEHVPVEAVHTDKLSHVIITCNIGLTANHRISARNAAHTKKEAAEAAS